MNNATRSLIVIAFVAVLGVGLWWALARTVTPANTNVPPTARIIDFDTCTAAGHPVVDTFSCTADTRTFVKVGNPTRGYQMEYEVAEVDASSVILRNPQLGFSLVYPRAYAQTPDPAVNGKVLLLTPGESTPIVVWSNLADATEPPVTWGDYVAAGDVALGGVPGKRFVYKRCDGPGCTADIVAYVVVRAGRKYALEFYGDATIDDTEQSIIDSYRFL